MFYLYFQNNSGGYYVTNAEFGIGEFIIIEANSENDADDKLFDITSNKDEFVSYCECCGFRWSYDCEDSSSDWRNFLSRSFVRSSEGYVHYLNGSIESI